MQVLRILSFLIAIFWLGIAVAQTNDVLAERIAQHDREIKQMQSMQMADRLARIETQLSQQAEDITQIKNVGIAAAGSIFLLLVDKVAWLLTMIRKK